MRADLSPEGGEVGRDAWPKFGADRVGVQRGKSESNKIKNRPELQGKSKQKSWCECEIIVDARQVSEIKYHLDSGQ